MPVLPALPLIDGCLFIDNSGWMEGMSTCTRYLQYKSLNLRIPSGEKPSLNFGSAIHLALEYRYRNFRNRQVDELGYYEAVGEMLTGFFNEHPPEQDDWRTLNWAMTLLRKYNAKYDIEEFNLLVDEKDQPMVELSFALPLYTHMAMSGGYPLGDEVVPHIPVIYTGRIDLPVSIDDRIFVMDHKTTGLLGDMFWNEMRMTSQQKGYCWAFSELTKKPVAGYIVNAIRSKEPPQYVTQGKPGKGGKTLTPETWWSESFQREKVFVTPFALAEWKNNTIDLVEEFFWHYSRGYMPMKTKWCAGYGKCPYFDVCRLDASDRDTMLASGMFADNVWTPLRQPTQIKQ